MICATWLDRPLPVAGRVIVKAGGHFDARLVKIDRDLALIPSMAIHMNRAVNEGYAYNKQIDMLPLLGGGEAKKGVLGKIIAGELGIPESVIYGSDLYLYNRMEPSVWGAEQEFISAPRLDDLQCAFSSLKAFLSGTSESSGKDGCGKLRVHE